MELKQKIFSKMFEIEPTHRAYSEFVRNGGKSTQLRKFQYGFNVAQVMKNKQIRATCRSLVWFGLVNKFKFKKNTLITLKCFASLSINQHRNFS